MPRTVRRTFPKVHSLYLAVEQDAQLRAYSKAHLQTSSEVVREALAAFFASAGPLSDPNDKTHDKARDKTRAILAELAHRRRQARGPASAPSRLDLAPVEPLRLWQPPALWVEPPSASPVALLLPLAWNQDGAPFDPPANTFAWRVLRVVAPPAAATMRVIVDRVELVLPLDATVAQLRYATSNTPGVYRLHCIDARGRALRAPVAIILLRSEAH